MSNLKKRCSTCGESKLLSEFNSNKFGKFGKYSKCKSCKSKITKSKYDPDENRKRNDLKRDSINSRQRQYYLENKEEIKTRNKKRYYLDVEKSRIDLRKRYRENLVRSILARAKQHAKEKGLEFNIDESDIVIPKVCPLLEIDLFVSDEKGASDNSPSIDRIDSTRGYIKGNVWIISWLANQMKRHATMSQISTFSSNWLRIWSDCAGGVCEIPLK